jgi:dCTP deaminase
VILPDHQISKLGQRGVISPFDPAQLEPASYDVRLGNDFKVFQRDFTPYIDLEDPVDVTRHVSVDDGDWFLLHPGEFVLGATKEVVHMPNNLVGRIDGKSSLGRLGLVIHVTAGYIDPGFQGPITLEMACFHPLPIALRPGKLIAQLSFHEMSAPAAEPYNGRYQGATTVESSKYGSP